MQARILAFAVTQLERPRRQPRPRRLDLGAALFERRAGVVPALRRESRMHFDEIAAIGEARAAAAIEKALGRQPLRQHHVMAR
jgi:hypothetical protein